MSTASIQASSGGIVQSGSSKTAKPITREWIEDNLKKLRAKGEGIYAKILPKGGKGGYLRIGGAEKYVKNLQAAGKVQPGNPFIYWPEYRVTGFRNDIIAAFTEVGMQSELRNLDAQAIDPTLADHKGKLVREIGLVPKSKKCLPGEKEAQPRMKSKETLDYYNHIVEVILAAEKAGKAAKTGAKVGKARAPTGVSREEQLKSQFKALWEETLNGISVPRVLNVSQYHVENGVVSGVRSVNAIFPNKPQARVSVFARPIITWKNREYELPLIYRKTHVANAQQFVKDIVGAVNIELADTILATLGGERLSPRLQRQPSPRQSMIQQPLRMSPRQSMIQQPMLSQRLSSGSSSPEGSPYTSPKVAPMQLPNIKGGFPQLKIGRK